MKKIFTILITLLIVGCSIENEEKDVYVPEDGYNSLIKQSRLDDCILLASGLDFNRNNLLDENEVIDSELLCPVIGDNGLNTLFNFIKKENCITIISGLDQNRNGVLDLEEEDKSETICAESGNDGNSGENGFNTITRIDNSDNCEFGGIEINVGLDTNRDNVLQDEEIQDSSDLCQVKCVKEHECVYEVYDTTSCVSGKLYSFWLDGALFSNISLRFRVFADGTARLWGKVARHVNDDLHTLDITFTQGSEDDYKYPNCIDDEVNVNEWIQYTELTGTLIADYTGEVYELSRRGEPTQFGIGANPTNQYLTLGFSGWVWATNHNNCKGDININIVKVCQ